MSDVAIALVALLTFVMVFAGLTYVGFRVVRGLEAAELASTRVTSMRVG